MTLRQLALLLFILLLPGCASEPSGPGEPPTEAASSARPARGALPDRSPAPIARAPTPRLAMAAWSGGIVLIDPASASALARAATTFGVVDLVHDPWRDRWVVVEYDDASANQISVWRVQAAEGATTLTRQHVVETGGYCRVAATKDGLLIFEDDGLHQRWHTTGEDLSAIAASGSAVAPASFAAWQSGHGSRMVALTAREEADGKAVSLIEVAIEAGRARVTAGERLEEWSKQATAPRMARAPDGELLMAGVQGRELRLARGHEDGLGAPRGVLGPLPDASGVEDVVTAAGGGPVMLLLSAANQLVVLRDAADRAPRVHGLPGAVGKGSYWAIARRLALDVDTGLLLVGMNDGVAAFGRSLDRHGWSMAPRWHRDGWRWPVAMQQR